MLGGESMSSDVDVRAVADLTEGFSGSDLRTLCTAAAMRPVRELLAASGKSAQQAASKKLVAALPAPSPAAAFLGAAVRSERNGGAGEGPEPSGRPRHGAAAGVSQVIFLYLHDCCPHSQGLLINHVGLCKQSMFSAECKSAS